MTSKKLRPHDDNHGAHYWSGKHIGVVMQPFAQFLCRQASYCVLNYVYCSYVGLKKYGQPLLTITILKTAVKIEKMV